MAQTSWRCWYLIQPMPSPRLAHADHRSCKKVLCRAKPSVLSCGMEQSLVCTHSDSAFTTIMLWPLRQAPTIKVTLGSTGMASRPCPCRPQPPVIACNREHIVVRIPVRGGVDLAGIIADVASSFSRGCGAETVAKACLIPLHEPGLNVFKRNGSAAQSASLGPQSLREADAFRQHLGIMTDQKTQASTCSWALCWQKSRKRVPCHHV